VISAFMFLLFRALRGSATTARNLARTSRPCGDPHRNEHIGVRPRPRRRGPGIFRVRGRWADILADGAESGMNHPWSRAGPAQWMVPTLLDYLSDPNSAHSLRKLMRHGSHRRQRLCLDQKRMARNCLQ
jgi:hypothetical protein